MEQVFKSIPEMEMYILSIQKTDGLTHYLNTNIYIANGVTGTQKEVIDYTGTYWFPSTIAFQ